MADQYIAGSGGGRKKKRNPRPAPPPPPVVVQQTVTVPSAPAAEPAKDDANTLFSKSSIRLIDLISEGEIEGFVNATTKKSIFLDDTVITNDDGTDNFVVADIETRDGTQAQSYISGYPSSENVVSVNTAVGDAVNSTVTRTVTNFEVDSVLITISIPQLFVIDNGLKKTEIRYQIDVQPSGGSFSTKVDKTVSGKCTAPYERSHKIELTGSAPWNIRLKRVEGAHDGTTNYRQLTFRTISEIVDTKLRYPLSALVGMRFEATQFQEIPTRSYDIKGVKVQIPSNGTVDSTTGAISYSGVWDGTFQTAWTTDPAWILRDLIVSDRYGLGRFVDSSQVDKWSLFEISKYCGELIDDGQGGTEPRFACNVYLQSRDEAFNVIQDFASVFRGMAYWSAGQIAFSQDKPSDAAALFTNANVLEGNFNYESSSLKARHTVALVTWNDPEQAYEQQVEYVQDQQAIIDYGILETRIAAFGCTSRGQAHRIGKWLLYQEQNESETVTFKVGLDGAIVRPGQIIKVMDRMKAGARKAGRVSSVSGTDITIDQAITVAENDTISVVLPDGSVEQQTIDAASTGTTISVGTAFSQTPAAQTVFLIETTDLVTQLFRVVSVTEEEETFQIVGLQHNGSKYNHVESGNDLEVRTISVLNKDPDAPTGLDIDEKLVESGNSVTNEITVSWKSVPNATKYKVSYKPDTQNAFINLQDTSNNSITFKTDDTGSFKFHVQAFSAIGKKSKVAELTKNITGKTAVPGNVQNLSFEATDAKKGTLRWDETVDLDVKVGGKVHIKHSGKTDGSGTWNNSVTLIKAVAGNSTEATIPLVEGEVCVKFADDGGRLSASETSVIIDLPDTLGIKTIETRREDQDSPPFQGTKTNTFYSDEFDALTLEGTTNIDDITDNIDDLSTIDFLGDIESSGNYEFANTLDLGAKFSLGLKRFFVTRAFLPNNLWDDHTDNIDDWDDIDGDDINSVDAKLMVRTTDDDPSGSPTWSSFSEFVNGNFKARAFQFRADLTSDDTVESILVDELGYEATLDRRTENSDAAVASGAGAKAVTFDHPFFVGTAALGGANSLLPSVGITGMNMQSGDYFELSSISSTGFTVHFKNSSDASVDRNFRWTAVGYGKQG